MHVRHKRPSPQSRHWSFAAPKPQLTHRSGTISSGGVGDSGALARAAGLADSASALATRLDALLTLAGAERPVLDQADIPALAAEAATQWTGTFNPRPMDEAAYAALFSAVGR